MQFPHLRFSTLTTGCLQIAYLHLQVRKNAQEHREGLLWHCMCLLYLIINKTQVQIERKKGEYDVRYPLPSASDGPCPRGWGPIRGTATFSKLGVQFLGLAYYCHSLGKNLERYALLLHNILYSSHSYSVETQSVFIFWHRPNEQTWRLAHTEI